MAAPPAANLRRQPLEAVAALATALSRDVRGGVDPWLLAITLLLLEFGLLMVYSASAVSATRQGHASWYYVVRQASFGAAGVVAMAVLARVRPDFLRRLTYPLLGLTVALMLVIVAGFGHAAGGAARWIALGPIHIQPAEFAKVVTVLWVSHSVAKKKDRIHTFSVGFLPHALVVGMLMLLCLKQPDFGSSVILLLLTFGVLFVAGVRAGYILGAMLAFVPVASALVMFSDYRRMRLTAWLNSAADHAGKGYQLWQATLAFGSGGLFGVGLGDSRQKFGFLPACYTDSIAPVIAEELGLVGLVAMMLAFAVLVWRGLRIAWKAEDDYACFVAFGISMLFALQVLINLGVAMGTLPTKGLTLPFISYGGSSLIVNLAAVGILLSISRTANRDPASRRATDGGPPAAPPKPARRAQRATA